MKYSIKMRIGERGQVVIPKALRERFGLYPNTDVEFVEEKGKLVVRPAVEPEQDSADAWDHAWGLLHAQKINVDADIEEMRGR
jgi:AbrB family looped-hinge helix DNA binding protein